MPRRIPILPAIVHMHMQITADPVIFLSGFADRPQLHGDVGGAARAHIDVAPLERKLESLHHLNVNPADWRFDRSLSVRRKIMRLKLTFLSIVSVSTANPRVARSKELPACIGHRNARRCCLPVAAKNLNINPSMRL